MKKLVLITALLGLTACGDKVSTNELEEQRGIVRENLMFNAQVYRTEGPRLGDYKIVPNGDSTMSVSCPQGDGWGTIQLISPEGRTVKLKCSTYSKNLSCQIDGKEFKYSKEEGRCASTDVVAYPIKKIAQ